MQGIYEELLRAAISQSRRALLYGGTELEFLTIFRVVMQYESVIQESIT